jgi:predicted aspartyl protease
VKQSTDFDPSLSLIIVAGEVSGPLGRTALRLVLDTGASETLLVPDVVDDLGYSPRNAETMTGVYSAIGKEQGYILRVAEFSALGFAIPDFRVHVFDLADRYAIDGLVGLSFLRRFNYEIRSAEGRIILDPVASS